ncbi:plasmid replication initiator TrfA [Escherichia coli]|nr:hypothetical protein [Escherichia coli]
MDNQKESRDDTDRDDAIDWEGPGQTHDEGNSARNDGPRAASEPVATTVPSRSAKAGSTKIDPARTLIKVMGAEKTLMQITAEQLSLFEVAPWQDDMRAIPNDLARTSLFTIRNKKQPRDAFVAHPIYSYNQNVQLLFTGVELRAEDDELVWQQLLEYSKHGKLGDVFYFSYYQLCNDLGWPLNGRYYDKAEKCLLRLSSATIQMTTALGTLDSMNMATGFKVAGRVPGGKPVCQIRIPEDTVYLFSGNNYSIFMWSKYRKLKPIARRLFDYFASHRTPFPLALDKFQLLCHSKTSRPAKWAEQTEMACSELLASGLVTEAWVDKGKVWGRRYKAKE